MQVRNTPQNYRVPCSFNGNWFSGLGKNLAKAFTPKVYLSETNQKLVNQTEDIALKFYNRVANEPITLSVKNGNKEFSFIYTNSSWHRVKINKKDRTINDFEIFSVREDKDYAFYSTGNYPSKITDEKYIKIYNDLLEDWLPWLIKKYEKLDKK